MLVPRTLRYSLTTLYGSNFEGGHFSRRGTASNGEGVSVPLYRHEVSLDYVRVELALRYAVTSALEIVARVPWEQKDQSAHALLIESATATDVDAMRRNIALHHRSVTLRGLGDFMLLGRRRWSDTLRADDSFALAFGATLPTGRTEEDPYRLGDAGVQHLHIQFGTGTVDPLIEASYSAPFSERVSAGGYIAGRLPLYENNRGFHAPPDATLGAYVSRRWSRTDVRLEGAVYAQGYGYWSGERDENTGLLAASVTAGATYRLPRVSISADLRYPISQRTLSDGDAFKQGPTVVVTFGGAVH